MTRRDKRGTGKPVTPRSPGRPAQPPRPQPGTRPARPKPGAWQMNPDLWYRPNPTLTWPPAPEPRQPDPGTPQPGHQDTHAGQGRMPVSFTLAFTAPPPEGAPPGAGQELGHALIRMLDAYLAHEQARWETGFEGEPFL